MAPFGKFKERWRNPNGYRRVLAISLPLVASMGSITVMQFTDRAFLANYSLEAISAALPSGIASFTAIAFFMGVAGYGNAFVAQYTGAGAPLRVGASLWQTIYFALISSLLLACLYFLARPLFELIGHDEAIRPLEIVYFRVLTLGAGLVVLGTALSTFFSGRGLTWTVMWAYLLGMVVNIPLDYAMINGLGPFPELGIVGAGLATVTSSLVSVLFLVALVFRKTNRERFGVWSQRRFDGELFKRLLVYGMPSGVQFFLEISGFTFFIFILGRLGSVELAASNIVLSLESVSFMPMVGFNIGVATLVGQSIGRGRPAEGEYAVSSTLHMTLLYLGLVGLTLVVTPEPLLNIFRPHDMDPVLFAPILALGVILCRFVAAFNLFDGLNLVYSGALKGAGDTRFIMWTIAAIAGGVMITPLYVFVELLGGGVYTTWTLATIYIASLGLAFMFRYRNGAWKSMKVIEDKLVPSMARQSQVETD